jgi:hypothetical protein
MFVIRYTRSFQFMWAVMYYSAITDCSQLWHTYIGQVQVHISLLLPLHDYDAFVLLNVRVLLLYC